jgi:hypothetical protein
VDEEREKQKRLRAMDRTRDQEVRAAAEHEAEERANAIRAEDEALLESSRGTAAYYDFQKKVIEETTKLDIEAVNRRRQSELDALAEREDDAKKDLETMKLSHEQLEAERAKITAAYAAIRVSTERGAASEIVAINTKKNADLLQVDEEYSRTKAKNIEVADTMRDEFDRIGTSATRSAKDVKEAIASMIRDMLLLGVRQKLLQPMSDWLFGKRGDEFGGVVGGGIQSVWDAIPHFASGTPATPDGLIGVGETGPEVIQVPRGSRVFNATQSKQMRAASAVASTVNHRMAIAVDLAGANGDAAIEAAANRGVTAAVAQIRREFPKLMALTVRDYG